LAREAVLAEFDAEMRRDPPREPGEEVERTPEVVRVLGTQGWIAYSHLPTGRAARVVRAEADRIRRGGVETEWKVYGHDRPRTLGHLLASNGFVADVPETLMVFDLRDRSGFGPLAEGVAVRRVNDRAGLEAAVRVSAAAFSPDPGWDLEDYLPRLTSPSMAIFLASVDGTPVSVGRLELPRGRTFASLWGGGTLPGFRGRGMYRWLVGARAELARRRGYRYLTVDARETSRLILERVGFRPLTSIVGWVLRPEPAGRGGFPGEAGRAPNPTRRTGTSSSSSGPRGAAPKATLRAP
jgi:GNAT superfamily N-acetyltransferase